MYFTVRENLWALKDEYEKNRWKFEFDQTFRNYVHFHCDTGQQIEWIFRQPNSYALGIKRFAEQHQTSKELLIRILTPMNLWHLLILLKLCRKIVKLNGDLPAQGRVAIEIEDTLRKLDKQIL